jgi:hypothetical protein
MCKNIDIHSEGCVALKMMSYCVGEVTVKGLMAGCQVAELTRIADIPSAGGHNSGTCRQPPSHNSFYYLGKTEMPAVNHHPIIICIILAKTAGPAVILHPIIVFIIWAKQWDLPSTTSP